MGWTYPTGATRKDVIEQQTRDWERTLEDGVTVKTTCLAHCYRGNLYSGVLWSVWERAFQKGAEEAQPKERWIACDLLQYHGDSWGYKTIEECMGPFYYSCPLGYLAMVPLEQFGGNAEWREEVQAHHARAAAKRAAKRAQISVTR